MARNFNIKPDNPSSNKISVAIGNNELSSGIPVSCKGNAAILDIIRVTTNSEGCNSPICRLPVTLRAKTTNM